MMDTQTGTKIGIKIILNLYFITEDPGFNWSGRKDLNLRPLAPHASTLPGCATPRDEG